MHTKVNNYRFSRIKKATNPSPMPLQKHSLGGCTIDMSHIELPPAARGTRFAARYPIYSKLPKNITAELAGDQ